VPLSITTATDKPDLMVSNYVDFDLSTHLHPASALVASGGCAGDVRAAGFAWVKNILYHNRGDGTFEDVTKKAHIDPNHWPLLIQCDYPGF